MELSQLVGQLVILGFHGSSLSVGCPVARDIRTHNLGGVVLFDKFLTGTPADGNIASPAQLRRLCAQLQDLAAAPLLIGIDQEGGKVRRLKPRYGFAELPSAAQMAGAGDPSLSRRLAAETGRTLCECGITCNFAPVADIAVNPDNPIIAAIERSFGTSAATVSRHCQAWLDGLRQWGISGCLKHFPGHGSSSTDSHRGFVDISASWRQEELLPYEYLISRGVVRMVMTGHLFQRGFDPRHPASLSRATTTGILREKLNFDGVIVTDDLQMRAITDHYGLTDAVVLALSAGADMIIIGNNLAYDPDILPRVVSAVCRAVARGDLDEESLYDSYRRVCRLKMARNEGEKTCI